MVCGTCGKYSFRICSKLCFIVDKMDKLVSASNFEYKPCMCILNRTCVNVQRPEGVDYGHM
jgi:hypothetical protein